MVVPVIKSRTNHISSLSIIDPPPAWRLTVKLIRLSEKKSISGSAGGGRRGAFPRLSTARWHLLVTDLLPVLWNIRVSEIHCLQGGAWSSAAQSAGWRFGWRSARRADWRSILSDLTLAPRRASNRGRSPRLPSACCQRDSNMIQVGALRHVLFFTAILWGGLHIILSAGRARPHVSLQNLTALRSGFQFQACTFFLLGSTFRHQAERIHSGASHNACNLTCF